ncbi:TPA: hypothetical protein ACH3X1_011934 [Trebouxia sp. C0004]
MCSKALTGAVWVCITDSRALHPCLHSTATYWLMQRFLVHQRRLLPWMSCSLQDRAHLRELLQVRLNGKVSGFRDAHLDAIIKQGLTSEDRLARTSWSELSQQALLPRVLVQALLEAYNSNALNGLGI